MSDALDRAVDVSVAAHTPDVVPPFATVEARRRARDRRRGGAAVVLTALAAAGMVVVPGALTGESVSPVGGPVQRFGYQASATDVAAFTGDPAAAGALQRCLALPGLSEGLVLQSLPAQYVGIVTGRSRAEALKACVDDVTGMGLTLDRRTSEVRTYTVRPAVRTVRNARLDEQREACFALPGVTATSVQENLPATYRVTVPAAEAELFEECIGAVTGLSVPELAPARTAAAWTGAEVCRVTTSTQCRTVVGEQAQDLDAVLASAEPAPPGSLYCEASSTLYRITFSHLSVRALPVDVPERCGPVRRGTQDLLADPGLVAAVVQAYEDAEPSLTDAQRAFVQECSARDVEVVQELVGLSEDAARAATRDDVRVVGRDGDCLVRRLDLRPDRVNLLVDGGTVLWAGRY